MSCMTAVSRRVSCRPDDQLKEFYDILKNKLLSYKGVKSRFSWGAESFRIGRKLYAMLVVKGKTLNLYLAMDPASLADTKFKAEDASDSKKYSEVPTRYAVKNPLRSRYASELIEMLFDGIQPSGASYTDYKLPYETTAKLVDMGLVKLKADGSTENARIVKADIAELIRSKITVAEADAIVPTNWWEQCWNAKVLNARTATRKALSTLTPSAQISTKAKT